MIAQRNYPARRQPEIGTAWWIIHAKRVAAASLWVELDGLNTPSSLEEFAKKNPNTTPAKIADLEVARIQLEPEGIDRLTVDRPDIRKAAIDSVIKACDSFAKLTDEFKDDLVIKVVCLMGSAKAEAALVGMLKDGTIDQYYGDPAKAIEWLDKVTEAAPDTDWGKDAKKLADSLRNMNTKQQVIEVQRSVYIMPTLGPKMPFDPTGKMPQDPAHGFPPQ